MLNVLIREYEISFKKTEKFRAQFLIETIEDLKNSLAELNISLIIDNSPSISGLINVIKNHEINDIYCQKEWTIEEEKIEKDLIEKLPKGFNLNSEYDQFLFHLEKVREPIKKDVFSSFRKKIEKRITVRECCPVPIKLDKSNLLEETFPIPKLEDLNLDPFKVDINSAFPFQGGTKSGLDRINFYFWKSKKLGFYKKTRNGLVGADYSTKFSPWLAGAHYDRELTFKTVEDEILKNQSTYWLIFELIWRDYFKYISIKHGNKIFRLGGIYSKSKVWKIDIDTINSWINGTTKESFINANMIELKKTGWMSNRGRQNVASYLTKDLLIDWRVGASYFESMLIDYDVHSNYGNWMYIAGVGNDPRNRKFNIRSQADRYDENGNFQQLWNQKSLFE